MNKKTYYFVKIISSLVSVMLLATSVGCSNNVNKSNLSQNNDAKIVKTQVLQDEFGTNVQYEWPDDVDVMPDTWVATDGLGRNVDTYKSTGELKQDKFVGMFYWTWHSGQAKTNRALDNTKILKEAKGSVVSNLNNTKLWGNYGEAHHWSEPLFGHYDMEDEWVLRRHAEMLANAGVDYVAMDNTNGKYTWEEGVMKLLKVWGQARKDGVRAPQITFMLPFGGGEDAKWQLYDLYQKVYKNEEYQDMFFYWDDKPLILCSADCLDESIAIDNKNGIPEQELRDFFTFRYCNAGYAQTDLPENVMQWMAVYPQNVSKDSDGNIEQVPVSISQNWSKEKGLTAMSDQSVDVFGRTYTVSNGYDTRENAKLYGANFEEQFNYAKNIDPEIIFITGWNEWVAGYFSYWQGAPNCFPDQFNQEFSRDIEPEAGDMADHYYNQLCDFVRQFKGTREVPKASEAKTIDMSGSIDQWNDVGPYFKAYTGNTFDRDADGYKGTHYTNKTGRNDLVAAKVARDADNLYFMVETKDDITSYTDDNWMRLFIDIDDYEYKKEDYTYFRDLKEKPNWESYEYIINRVKPTETTAVLEKSTGGWNWKRAGEVEYTVDGKYMQIKVPKSLLGLDKVEDKDLVVNFKWADNNLADGKGNIMDFYTDGDTAPSARFKYQYRTTLMTEVIKQYNDEMARLAEEARILAEQEDTAASASTTE